MNFTKSQLYAACAKFGAGIGPLPSDGSVDGVRLLWGLSGVESSFGADCAPRHQPAYDVGGRYAVHAPMPQLSSAYAVPYP